MNPRTAACWTVWALALAGCHPASPLSFNRGADHELTLLRDQGDLKHLARAEELTAASLRLAPAETNLGGRAMEGRVAMAAHRFEAARASAAALRLRAPTNPYCLGALGDALYELGSYEQAAATWTTMEGLSGITAGSEARWAQLDLIHGQVSSAKRHLAAALRLAQAGGAAAASGVAGCAVQCGEAAFRSGDWTAAEENYQLALRTVPDCYLAVEHLAELRGAQKRIPEALALYENLLRRVGRPELMQDIGDLLAFEARGKEAAPWHQKAKGAYLASIDRGEVLYLHHLSGLFADSLGDPEQAIAWARRDLAYRRSIQAYDALAWALDQAGQLAEAEQWAAKALATGSRDPHILYHAGMIRTGAGDVAGGGNLLRQATASNPTFNAFHVHR